MTLRQTGQLRRPDTLAVFVGGVGHFVLVVACAAAFQQLSPARKEWRQFLGGAVMLLAYFGAIVATMRPH